MFSIPKLFIVGGVIMIVIGVIWHYGGRVFHFGRLPGDIVVEKENVKFYFPIVSCIVISVIGSLLLYLVRLFK